MEKLHVWLEGKKYYLKPIHEDDQETDMAASPVETSGDQDPVSEGTRKVKGGYENIGKKGKHSKKPMTKKKANAQRKAMFANGFKEEGNPGAS